MSEKFDFNDILIVPKAISDINSRNEINPYLEDGRLPIFNSPMDTVISNENQCEFINRKINTCLPRGVESDSDSYGFNSYSLTEISELYYNNQLSEYKKYLIDIANGHMKSLLDMIIKIKTKYPKLILMVGNIANPETYKILSNAGADFIRVGIGNGCFVDGTKITMDNGYKKIEEIKIDDKVLTHKGQYKRVLATKRMGYSSSLISINDEISCTPDHKLYVLNKKYINIVTDENCDMLCEWISAMELLTNSEYLLIENNNSFNKLNDGEN